MNLEWDNIVQEETARKGNLQNLGSENSAFRGSTFLEKVQRRNKQRETNNKKYIRNKPTRAGHNDPRYTNVHSHTNLQSSMINEIDSKNEKAEAQKILKIELLIIMLQRRNIHTNMISDFEMNRCKIYLGNIVKNHPD